MKKTRTIIFSTALLFFCSVVSAQESQILQVLQAGRLEFRTLGDAELRELIGNVRMQQDNVHIACDRATQNITQNTVTLSGNVVIRQDTLLLRTNHGYYDANTRIARSYEGVQLFDGHVHLSALIGSYETGARVADFLNNVTIDDTAATIHASAVRYDRRSGLILATRNVRIRFKDQESLITADSVRHYPDERRTQFFLDPALWQSDSSYIRRNENGDIDSLRLDTLYIAADYMEAFRDTGNRFIAEGDVRMVQADFSARGGKAAFLRSDSLIIVEQAPILWFGENQLTGDSVAARMTEGTLRHLHVIGNTFSISRSKPAGQDSLYPPDRFDQTSGREMQMFFEDNRPHHVRIEGSAISLYYLYEDGALNGLRLESGDLILLDFVDGKAKYIRTIGGVEGTYYPEKYVTGVESSYDLEGFFWREDRPVQQPWPQDTVNSDTP